MIKELPNQFSESNLDRLLIKKHDIKFIHNDPELLLIRDKRDKGDRSVRASNHCRFEKNGISSDPNLPDGDFPAYIDPRFPSYNANQYPSGYFLCEGPAPDNQVHFER